MRCRKISLALFICLGLIGSLPISVKAAIDLLYFQATTGSGYVQLDWETATELNNAGFFVQRSLQENQGYTRIHDELIPAQGSSITGASYQYVDAGLTNGTQYWYRLESIDFGQNSEFSAPVFVIVGGTPTPTPTGTILVIPTATNPVFPTMTPTTFFVLTPSPTLAPSPTTPPVLSVSSTPIPGTGIITPPGQGQIYPVPEVAGRGTAISQAGLPANPSMGEGGTLSAAPPLEPFPIVTIVFPTSSIENPLPDVDKLIEAKTLSWSKVIQLWPLGVILIAWVGVAIWFYLSNRQFK